MNIDYSKWDKLDCSDDEESPKLNVVKLNKNQQVILNKEGYKIKEGDSSNDDTSKDNNFRNKTNLQEDVSKEWYKRVLHGIVTVNSHIFSQDRYLVNFLLVVDFNYKKLDVKLEENSITIFNEDKEVFFREFYSKIRKDENFWNWELVTLEVDWESLKDFSKKVNEQKKKSNLTFINKKNVKFLEVNLHKLIEIQDCFIWWPKLFKDDSEEIRVVDNSEFIKIWDEAHESFRKKVANLEKIPIQ